MSVFVCVLICIHRGHNVNFKDPSLTLFQVICGTMMMWFVAMIMEPHTRQLIVITSLSINIFTMFKFTSRQMLTYTIGACLSLGVVLLLQFHLVRQVVDYPVEFLIWLAYTVLAFVIYFQSYETNRLRSRLGKQNEKLRGLLRQMRKDAITDELTGLFNRRYIMVQLNSYKALADREGFVFSICYIDIDNFKEINDQFGHHEGDKVLRRLAQVLMASVRQSDTVARVGGEEFLLVMPNRGEVNASAFAESLRARISHASFGDLVGLNITISIGVAINEEDISIDQLVSRADQGLYKAKQNGRDQVFTF